MDLRVDTYIYLNLSGIHISHKGLWHHPVALILLVSPCSLSPSKSLVVCIHKPLSTMCKSERFNGCTSNQFKSHLLLHFSTLTFSNAQVIFCSRSSTLLESGYIRYSCFDFFQTISRKFSSQWYLGKKENTKSLFLTMFCKQWFHINEIWFIIENTTATAKVNILGAFKFLAFCMEIACPRTAISLKTPASGWPRTPENALRTLVRKPQIFIRTVLANFYPETGFGSRLGQFLSGRRIWLNFFSLDTIPELNFLCFMYHASFIWDITVICHLH